jgi:hypothetical protein
MFIKNIDEAPRSVVVATWEAFSSLPNLQEVLIAFQHPMRYTLDGNRTVYHGTVDSSHEQNLIMEMVSHACPRIQTLTIAKSSERFNLSYLTNFHDLRHLSFNGKISTSPEDSLQILRSLKHLDTLTLVPPPARSWLPSAISSLTPGIIGKMNPLRSISLMCPSHLPPSDIFSAAMLQAFASHKDSLRSLSIDVYHSIDGALMEELLNFISTSYLTKLTITLCVPKPCACVDIHSYFPASIKTRQANFESPKELEIWAHPWMNENLHFYMQGDTGSLS